MISWVTLLICLLEVSAEVEEISIGYNKSSSAYFKEQNLTLFISSKPIKLESTGSFRYSLVTGGDLETWEEAHIQSYFMICSALPGDLLEFLKLAEYLENSCHSIIPITSNLFKEESSPGGSDCYLETSADLKLLLMSVVYEEQLSTYLQSKLNPVSVRTTNSPCHYHLKTVFGVQSVLDSFHIDASYVSNSGRLNTIIPTFGGFIGTNGICSDLIIWTINNGTFAVIANTRKDTWAFHGGTLIEGTSLLVRCILRKNWHAPGIALLTFLSYYCDADDGDLILERVSKFDHPPISPENPYICLDHINTSSNVHIPVSDMQVSGITPFNGIPDQVSVLACSAKSNNGSKLCKGNFLPIFYETPVNFRYNSSFFLGPSHRHDTITLYSNEGNHSAFCLELVVTMKSKYMIDVILFAAAGGRIPPNSRHFIDLSCTNNYGENLTAIMYRTHTHKFGKSVSMWIDHKDTWTLIASENRTNEIVQLSEPFNIRTNDSMNVRCSYDTIGSNKTLYIGEDGEMCNFYLYIIRKVSSRLEMKDCFRETKLNPPDFRDKGLDHQQPRRPITYSTKLRKITSWPIEEQISNGNPGIFNLGHVGTSIVILQSPVTDFSQDLKDRFDDKNVLIDFLSVIKTNVLTVTSWLNRSLAYHTGANRFYLPSGLHVNSEGKTFISDLGLHQVVIFNKPDFQLRDAPALVLGTAFDPGNDSSHFCMPTSVLTDIEGDIYVGDGLCNSRIVKFDNDGHFVGSFGASSSEKGLSGTFGEVTDITLDITREVILALDNKLKQIQVMDFLGNFYQVIDVSRYRNTLKISYSLDMDTILILTSYGLESNIIILDPVTGAKINSISGETRRFTAMNVIPGNNTVLIGDSSGFVSLYSNSVKVTNNEDVSNTQNQDFSPQTDDDESLSKIYPLIHFLYKPGLADPTQPPKRFYQNFTPLVLINIAAGGALLVLFIVVLVFTVRFCRKRGVRQEYQNILQSESEGEEEELLYERMEMQPL